MVMFETVNELCLKITCRGGGDHIFTKAGAFIGGECIGPKNYTFTKVMLGPQEGFGQALLGQLTRRITGENLPLTVDFFETEAGERRESCPHPEEKLYIHTGVALREFDVLRKENV